MGMWAQGGDKPLAKPGMEWMGARAVTDDYMDDRGRNVASIINGKLYVYDPAHFDPSVVAGVPGLQVATAQETASILDPDSPENSQGGSDLSNIMKGLAFVGGGAALTGGSGLFSTLAKEAGISMPSFPTLSGTPDASWGANPRFSGPFIGDELNPPTMGELAPSYSGPFIGDELNPPTGSEVSNFYNSPAFKMLAPAAGAAASTLGSDGTQAPAPVEERGKAYGGPGASAATGTALSRLLDGTATSDDWLKLGGTALSGGLGAFAANQQSKTLAELAREQRGAEKARYDDLVRRESERYADLKAREDVAIGKRDAAIQFGREVGAPSRARYEGSYAPGFSMESDPGYKDALDQTAKATLHGLSVNGNPAGSPNAWATTLKDLYEKTAYPALQTYRSNNAATGGFGSYAGEGATVPGLGTSLPGSTAVGATGGSQAGFDTRAASTGADANVWNALGTAAGDVFAPKRQLSLADIAKMFSGGGNSIFTVA